MRRCKRCLPSVIASGHPPSFASEAKQSRELAPARVAEIASSRLAPAPRNDDNLLVSASLPALMFEARMWGAVLLVLPGHASAVLPTATRCFGVNPERRPVSLSARATGRRPANPALQLGERVLRRLSPGASTPFQLSGLVVRSGRGSGSVGTSGSPAKRVPRFRSPTPPPGVPRLQLRPTRW